eukprot:706266_1
MTSNPFAMSKRKRKGNSVIPVIPLTNPKSSQRRRISASGITHNTTQHNNTNTNTKTTATKHKHNGLKMRGTYHKGNPHPQSTAQVVQTKSDEILRIYNAKKQRRGPVKSYTKPSYKLKKRKKKKIFT